ncbi:MULTISPECIES: hypothetical protein [unclassified Pseudoalteromonas]|uniref:hypothetical protein n=1 Tax=unclassified Pseudoalteromonas TaxID=194690 RepID=UPI0015FF8C73|nr:MULTISPECIES: hypothetical protein [unclassified Pseudoalteromonas]MBB1398605.1 hypothetical protein [Pseudoalteromonas sp. SG44-8]MBB1409860.1 hypothetical protein [Pseudoalteromonas sp. SG44-17]
MSVLLDTEVESINQIARFFIKQNEADSFPKELHDTLNNIFTKGHVHSVDSHTSKSQALAFRKAVITVEKRESNNRAEHKVIRGRKPAIYNALCLYALIGTAGTKKVFQEYYTPKSSNNKREFELLDLFAKKELSAEMLFFGVSQSSFDNIKNKLIDDNFNLFTEQLPSPFQYLKAGNTDLSPLGVLYDRDVNWHSFIKTYIKADKKLKSKECMEAKNILQNVTDKRLLQLPLVKELSASIDSQIDENKDAWEYLQNILN